MLNKITTLTLNKDNITDFSFERNSLLSKVKKNHWIFFLDSDEKLIGKLGLIPDTFAAYKLIRKNYFLDQYVGKEEIIRIIKKGSGSWERAVHETWRTNHKVGAIRDCFIYHNTASNLKTYLKKLNKYSDIHAIENRKEGKTSNISKIVIFPIGKFFINLFRSQNIVFSIMQSLHSFLSWTKLYFLQH